MGAALARAYAVVREWGGELGFESEAPRGSVFTMYLPLAEPEAETKIGPQTAAARPADAQRETILVVDDEAGIRSLIAKILRREQYNVLEAGTATEAAAIAAKHGSSIQLLVTDVMLPDRNGRQLAEKLVGALPKLKVMYISGFTDDESVRAGAFPPGARFLQKPFTLGALIGTVRETLDQ
jgi:CheY-like chemotaxis protein